MTIRLYGGEFLISPAPLHLDMNWCSHACFYCFANLNRPDRRLDLSFLSPLLKALSSAEKEPTVIQWLARRGYPVLVSNTVDPFAVSNYMQFMEIHSALKSVGVRFMYQTKGGNESAVETALSDEPTTFYVTVSSDDDAIIKANEPGAPLFAQRVELIMEAKRRGHHVILGINPYVPQWWNDIDGFVQSMLDNGVKHAWVQPLHLSRIQVAAMQESIRKRNANLVDYAMKKSKPDETDIHFFIESARRQGMKVIGDGTPDNDFWRAHFDTGAPFWPTLIGWFDHLDQVGAGLPVEFGLDDFAKWCDVGAPSQLSVYKELVQPFGRSIRNKQKTDPSRAHHDKPRSIREVIDVMWHIFDYQTPLRHFRIAVASCDQGRVIYTDDAGRPIFVYVPSGSYDEVFDVDKSETVRYWSVS